MNKAITTNTDRGCGNTFLIFAILLILSVFMCTRANGQYKDKQPNALYISFQPTDLGLGLRYDYSFHALGIYGSVSYGNWNDFKRYDIQHHIKYTVGISLPMPDYMGWHYAFNAGLNYHTFGNIPDRSLNPLFINPWSFELGLSVKMEHFAIAVRTDILGWLPCVDIGIPLKYGK
jgi:hypothetical protein